MFIKIAIAIACTLNLILAGGSAREVCNSTNYVIVNSRAGENDPSCLEGNMSHITPCKDLSYVFHNIPLSNKELILQEDHYITQTLTIPNVTCLTIRGNGSTIHCRSPNSKDMGSGLVFESVSNVRVLNVTFQGCGALQYSTTLRKYPSAVYIINSTNIYFTQSRFHRSVGRGLSLYDVTGHVEIRSTIFSENMVPKEENFGGGGLYIEFTYCTPGYSNCSYRDNIHSKNSTYMIQDCVFHENRASNGEVTKQPHIIQFQFLGGKNAGQGGGIAIAFKGTALGNSISIINCTFDNNSAQYGGGIDAIFQDYASENAVHISNCTFRNNNANEGGGGALQLGYIYVVIPNVSHNNVTIQGTDFVDNSAGWGGAVAFFSTPSKDVQNKLHFINCKWIGNSALMGAGIFLSISAQDSIFDGALATPLLHKCSFINNHVTIKSSLLKTTNEDISQHVLESGVLNIDSIEVNFSEEVTFNGSNGSAIFSISSQINILENTQVQFHKNSATNGGAIALLGSSVLKLFNNSHIIFDSNVATELGGALYVTSPHQVHFIFSHNCFISYHSINTHPDDWNASLTFTNNHARYGHAIYMDSLLLCENYIVDDTTAAFRWNSFVYNQEDENCIATSPVTINFTLPGEIIPGQRINIQPLPMDDLGQIIPTALRVLLDYVNGSTHTSSYISDDGYLQITGKPDTEFNLTVQTQNTRRIQSTESSRLGNCPLGFTMKNDTCICSASTSDKRLIGITECNMSSFNAFLQIGYWIGCNGNDEVFTSHCCEGYCKYHSITHNGQMVIVPKYCKDLNICNLHRKGQLCGECEEGYTSLYHSEYSMCGRCSYGAAGLLFYVISELVPLTLLFAIIMVMKLKVTSGIMQSLLLFAQTITFISRTPSFIIMSRASQTFLRIHNFLFGFLSLDFFRLDQLSFCLWSGATVLDNMAFRYLTTLYAILLLSFFILLVKNSSSETKLVRIVCSEKLKNCSRKNKLFKNAIIHGITTLLILSYTQYTLTSFQILSRQGIHGEGEKTVQFVIHLQGNVEYFGADHLPYAIPALLVLIFLTLPPPLLLISYPLLWKIKAKIRWCKKTAETENDTTLWPIRKLLPFIDSFQGVFRDNCRMFAGLLFLWRVILAAFFALCSDTECYIMTVVALICILIIHAVARPYKRRLFNVIDITMLANMCIITALSWYIVEASLASHGSTTQHIEAAIWINIILMYLPVFALVLTVILWLLVKFSIMPQINFLSSEDDESNAVRSKVTNDEELFARAAELNIPPLTVSSSEMEFTLRTNKTTQQI